MDKKALIAFVLCGIIMLYFFNKMQPPQQPVRKVRKKLQKKQLRKNGRRKGS